MGHSWSGLLAMFYAVKYPGNLWSLLLINPSTASSRLQDQTFKTMELRTTRQESVVRAALVQTEAFKKRAPAAMAEFFRIQFRGMFHDRALADILTLTFDDGFAVRSALMKYLRRDKSLSAYDIHKQLNVVSCPALIVTGDSDPPRLRHFIRSVKTSAARKHLSRPNAGTFHSLRQKIDFSGSWMTSCGRFAVEGILHGAR